MAHRETVTGVRPTHLVGKQKHILVRHVRRVLGAAPMCLCPPIHVQVKIHVQVVIGLRSVLDQYAVAPHVTGAVQSATVVQMKRLEIPTPVSKSSHLTQTVLCKMCAVRYPVQAHEQSPTQLLPVDGMTPSILTHARTCHCLSIGRQT